MLVMVISTAGCSRGTTVDTVSSKGTTSNTYPSYLNLGSSIPVVKSGQGNNITLSLAIVQPAANGGKWDGLWVAKYIKQYMNINLKVTQILDTALKDKKSLMFASGDLPDMMMNLGASTGEIYTYGQTNGQLLALDKYISKELTPNIYSWLAKRSDAKAASTTPDGHIYTLPKINDSTDAGNVSRLFINQTWLKKCGLTTPTTLDSFVTMLETFKQKDPGGVGSKNVVPMGGGYANSLNLGYYFLNAMGYVAGSSDNASYGLYPAIRNGKCELPCGNSELFLQYLTLMKKCYNEGLISKDYFTMDNTEAVAQVTSGDVGVFGEPVYVTGIKTWADWWAVKPLTSQWSSTPVWDTASSITVGNFAISIPAYGWK
jgi:putative aldouronate transport system substrate-binding protein